MNTAKPVDNGDYYEAQRDIVNASVEQDAFDSFMSRREQPSPVAQPNLTTPVVGASTPPDLAEELDPQGTGLLTTLGKAFDFMTAPLTALGDAALAPIEHSYENEDFMGQLGEALQVSGKAFMDRVFPTYGEEKEYYARTIVDREFADAPELIKGLLTTGLDVLADPTTTLGIGSMKVVQKGLAAKRAQQTAGLLPTNNRGIIEEGFQQLMGLAGMNPADDLSNIGELARRADRGDKAALEQLNVEMKLMGLDDVARQVDDTEVESAVKMINEVLGDPNAADLTIDTAKVTQDMLVASLDNKTPLFAGNINLSRMNTKEDVDRMLVQLEGTFSEQFKKATRGVRTNEETLRASQNIQLRELIGKPTTEFSAEEAYALRNALATSSDILYKLSMKASLNADSLHNLAFEKAFVVHMMLMEKATGVASEAGRLLQQYNMVAKVGRGRYREVQDMLLNKTGLPAAQREIIKKMMATMGDTTEINRFMAKGLRSKIGHGKDILFEHYVNAILSGPITHAVNIASNTSMVLMRPTEKVLQGMSAAARLDFKEAVTNMAEFTGMLAAILSGTGDISRLAYNTLARQGDRALKHFKMELPKFDVSKIHLPEELERMHELAAMKTKPAIDSRTLGVQGPLASIIDFYGNMVRIPGNALLKEDKAFKLLQYRMEVNAQAARRAMAQKSGRDAGAVFRAMKNNPDENIVSQAIEMANYYTFTNKLGPRMEALGQAVTKVPGLQYFIPFFRTPTNIVKFGVRNSLVGNVFNDLVPALKLGAGAKGDVARAKLAIGTFIPAAIVAMMGEDFVTGAVDRDTPEGRFQAQNGKPPYSIMTPWGWVSYERFEPLRSILGLMASYRDIIKHTDWNDESQSELAQQAASTVIGTTIKSSMDVWFLDSFGQVYQTLVQAQEGNFEPLQKHLSRMAASTVVPNFLAQTNTQYFETSYRMADGFLDEIKKRMPSLSKELPPNIDALDGEPIPIPENLGVNLMSPFLIRPVNEDPLSDEIIRLDVNISSLPKRIEAGGKDGIPGVILDLTTEQRYRYGRFAVGKDIPGAPTLRSQLEKMLQSDIYKYRLSDAQKRARIESYFRMYRTNAKERLLATELKDQFMEKLAAKREADEQQMRERIMQ